MPVGNRGEVPCWSSCAVKLEGQRVLFLRISFSVMVQSCSGRASLEEQRKSADRSRYGIVVGQRTPSECEAKHRLGKLEILGKDVLVVLSAY